MPEFAFYAYVKEWPNIIEAVSRAEPHLRLIGRPTAADMLVRAYGQLRDDLEKLGPTMAVAGTATLREMEKATRVRPDTGGAGGPRLETSLFVRQVGGALMPGSIGIAELDILEKDVPWWITNEIGSSARVGGRLFGYFTGGSSQDAPPDPTQFREHPLFQTGSSQDPISGLGIIQHPIPARRFIERSIPLIDKEWRTAFEAIRSRFEGRLDSVMRTFV